MSHRSRRQSSWVGDDIMERRLLDALVLTLLELRNFSKLIKNKATVDATGYVSCVSRCYTYAVRKKWQSVWPFGRIDTYRRGVCVARFDKLGNAKASKG